MNWRKLICSLLLWKSRGTLVATSQILTSINRSLRTAVINVPWHIKVKKKNPSKVYFSRFKKNFFQCYFNAFGMSVLREWNVFSMSFSGEWKAWSGSQIKECFVKWPLPFHVNENRTEQKFWETLWNFLIGCLIVNKGRRILFNQTTDILFILVTFWRNQDVH